MGFSLRDALPEGTIVGRYVINGVLGHGGYSIVYQAKHIEVEQTVALKEYLPSDLSVRDRGTVHTRSMDTLPHYEDGKRRFLEEAKRIAQFQDDPGVVTCLDFFRANGTAYLVMEHIDGMSLAEQLRDREASGHPYDERDLLATIVPLLTTLTVLHKADVLHRDIKPSNILLRRSDQKPVLIDFGAAKQQVAIHSKSAAPFTDGYAALEQVGEGELGPWTDVYGVGGVMWRMVAGGDPPWHPPNPKKVQLRIMAVLTGKPDPLPSATEVGINRFSQGLLIAIDQCLSVQEARRFQNCEQLLRALDAPSGIVELPKTSTVTQSNDQGALTRPPTRPGMRGYISTRKAAENAWRKKFPNTGIISPAPDPPSDPMWSLLRRLMMCIVFSVLGCVFGFIIMRFCEPIIRGLIFDDYPMPMPIEYLLEYGFILPGMWLLLFFLLATQSKVDRYVGVTCSVLQWLMFAIVVCAWGIGSGVDDGIGGIVSFITVKNILSSVVAIVAMLLITLIAFLLGSFLSKLRESVPGSNSNRSDY